MAMVNSNPQSVLKAHNSLQEGKYLNWANLRGYCTPKQKLACFVLYLKIINTFLKNNVYIL